MSTSATTNPALVPAKRRSVRDFLPGYQAVAWVSWVPNALWAEWYVRRTAQVPLPVFEALRAA